MTVADKSTAGRFDHVTFISAGAGSGKTYRLIDELEKAIVEDGISPAGILATTFTVKAASELRERVRDRLLAHDRLDLAERTAESLIGTVHGVCERLLKRFAFELGLSPQSNVMSIEDGARFFNQALDHVLPIDRVREMNAYARRLGMVDRGLPTWQGVVKSIADKARENNLSDVELRAMGKRNADDLLAFFPAPSNDDPTQALADIVATTIRELPQGSYKGIDKYRALLEDQEADLAEPDCPWSVWMRLAGTSALKSIADEVGRVQSRAACYASHPGFHGDLRGYTQGLFEIAADTLERFQAAKRERGLIDFNDMEQLMLQALEEEAVRTRLAGEIDLLLVDEFQDTNPMQLALFLKFATLADKAIFVGDVKQAIYEFRGCDPTLVFDTLNGLTAGDAQRHTLKSSWRSRPALVSYVNELFASAFVHDIPRDLVVLDHERDEFDVPAVSSWIVEGNVELRALAVAEGVARLIAEQGPVFDPETKRLRPISYGDVAVLARTNVAVERIARSLRQRRLPMKMTLTGLLETPEVSLAKSCLRRLADRADTLATAEIMALADCAEPEQWLTDRLHWLDGDNDAMAWGEADHPIIRRLFEMRAESALRSPVEIVARVLNEVDIRRIAAAWGPDEIRAAQRQRNLDAFLDLAVEYEKHAASHHEPGTLTGFLFWLEHPNSPDLDLQPVVTTGDAVHVLTYHRAKGLEWPVVVCTDFDYQERSRTYDVRVELAGDFDIDDPLANRAIRYWPDIFGRRRNGVPARQAMEDSPEGRRCRDKSEAEQRRLAYVGMTRARDRLVIAVPPKFPRDAWFHSFRTDFAIPTADSLRLPNGETTPSRAEVVELGTTEPDPLPYSPRWFERRERVDYPPKYVQPSSAEPVDGASVGDIIEVGERIALKGNAMADVGNGLHAVLAAELVNPLPDASAIERAEELLAGHGAAEHLDARDAIAVARRFARCLEERFQVTSIQVEVPILHALDDGRVVRGFVDVLAETEKGWLVIDHKSSPQPPAKWPEEAMKYSGQLAAYRTALMAAGRDVAGCILHFAVTGGVVEVCVP
ncbi:MAG: AAA family ATPase [Gammaproteobacteria bacterium]|nr:AAA family ATPase [Gammaproteobacteria bacterium]MYK45244.1 AAA family ATPase [Gammaproteobacteria bacterium]